LDNTVAEVNKLLVSVDSLLNDPDTQQMTAELNATMVLLRSAMQQLSPQLNSGVGELKKTLSNLEELTRTLADKPNALLLPIDFPADQEPRAKLQ
jgi:paraquat-inducible protein B